MVAHTSMPQSLVDRLVTVGKLHIFSDHGNGDFALRVFGFVNQIVPAFQVGRWRVDVQMVTNEPVQTLLVQDAWHFVNGVNVGHGNDAPCLDIGEERNLVFLIVWNHAVCTTQECIGLDTNFAQLLDGVLCWFGFKFACCGNPRHIGEVHKGSIVGAQSQAELAHGL